MTGDLPDKISTGVAGLDDVLGGGYPAASPVLISGSAGTGKTVLGLCFAHDAVASGEGAVLVTCDESPARLLRYMDALGLGGTAARDAGRLIVLDLRPLPEDVVAGAYDLGVIQLRIAQAIAACGATRLVIDPLDNLQLALSGGDLRPDILALFHWIRESGLSAVITLSQSFNARAQQRFEEYAADCAIFLSQQLREHLMTRYLRVVKMRGSGHGTNEYPFLLDAGGVSLLPVTGAYLTAAAPTTRSTTGIAELDRMVGGEGYLDGSAIMVSGSAGTGKSVLASSILHAALVAGRKAVYISLEESPAEIMRNLRSVGMEFAPFVASGQLEMHSVRSVEMGLESHLISISRLVEQAGAQLMVLDPISALADLGTPLQVKMMLVRFANRLKSEGVTLLVTELLGDSSPTSTQMNISSLSDVWIKLRRLEEDGELRRMIHVVKARGGATSSRVREFTMSAAGVQIGK